MGRIWHSPTITSWASFAAKATAYLLLLPLVLNRLSTTESAVWLLLAALASFQTVFDAGLSQTFVRIIAYARGGATVPELAGDLSSARTSSEQPTTNEETLSRVLSTMGLVYTALAVVAVIVLGIAGAAALRIPIEHNPAQGTAWTAAGIALLTTSITLWGNSFSSYLMGTNQIALVRRWEVCFAILALASAALVILSGGGLLGLVISEQSWALMAVLRNRALCRRHTRFRTHFRLAPDNEVLSLLWPSAWRTAIGALGGFGVIQLSGVMFAQFSPPEQAAAYLLALRLIQAVSQFSQAPYYSRLPTLAVLYSENRIAEALAYAKQGMRLSHWTFVGGYIAVGALAPAALTWLGSETGFVPISLWSLMGAAYFAERLGAMHIQLYTTTGKIIWHIANGLCGLGMLIFCGLTYSHLGATSFPVAMLLSYSLVYTPITVQHAAKAFAFNWLSFERTVSFPAIITAALASAALLAVYSRVS